MCSELKQDQKKMFSLLLGHLSDKTAQTYFIVFSMFSWTQINARNETITQREEPFFLFNNALEEKDSPCSTSAHVLIHKKRLRSEKVMLFRRVTIGCIT